MEVNLISDKLRSQQQYEEAKYSRYNSDSISML